MTEQAASSGAQPGSTSDRILDAAEDLFAEKGYSATSLGDVADRVGIRSPSLYNHFRNKEALYAAVLDRLLVDFTSPLAELASGPVTREQVVHWLEYIVRHPGDHFRSPVHDLSFAQYFLLDVFAFLAAIVGLILFASVKCCTAICCGKKKPLTNPKKKKN